MSLSEREERVLKETRLRNLKRRHARIANHSDLYEETIAVKKEIDKLTNELN